MGITRVKGCAFLKNKPFIIVILFSLFLVACQSESNDNKSTNAIFKGGTDMWSAELHMINKQEHWKMNKEVQLEMKNSVLFAIAFCE